MLLDNFKKEAFYRIDENTRMAALALKQLEESLLWEKPNSQLNSVGNLLLHLCGNLNQYIQASLGNKPDARTRKIEFSTTGGFTKKELFEKLINTINEAKEVIQLASEEDFNKIYEVQGYSVSGIGLVLHVTEHFSYHTGQIAFWVKYLTKKDLGFYQGQNLN